jgi:hypothetical protein
MNGRLPRRTRLPDYGVLAAVQSTIRQLQLDVHRWHSTIRCGDSAAPAAATGSRRCAGGRC